MLSRVRLEDIEDTCRPDVLNLGSLRSLGRGIPACPGTATGVISFQASDALRRSRRGEKVLFVREEVSPDDAEAISASQGVLTSRGGMTSHAALICRGWAKPCVIGFEPMQLRPEEKVLFVSSYGLLRAGKWITVDGNTGEVYAGRAERTQNSWRDQPDLQTLAQIIELGIKGDDVPANAVGRVWRIRDFFAHHIPIKDSLTSKRQTESKSFVSFVPPTQRSLDATKEALTPISSEDEQNYGLIILSMADTLERLLKTALGLGNHHLYFRPLWDPKSAIFRRNETEGAQMIGFEFFDINRYIPHLIDIATLTFVLDVELKTDSGEWFLDFTNSLGESLVPGSHKVKSYEVRLNDAQVQHSDLPLLYHALRRREYEWRFYEANETSHGDIIDFLSSREEGKRTEMERLVPICYRIGSAPRTRINNVREEPYWKCP